MAPSTYRHIQYKLHFHYAVQSDTRLDFSQKRMKAELLRKRSTSAIAQPKQFEALFSPVTVPR